MRILRCFIGGIHGTGKSTFAKTHAMYFNARHIEASEIIYSEKQRTKAVDDIQKNQDVLVTGFNRLPSANYIMTGHYTLLANETSICRVPQATFGSLCPQRLILLVCNPTQIYKRLLERDKTEYSLDLLTSMQEEEKRYYIELCSYFQCAESIFENNF